MKKSDYQKLCADYSSGMTQLQVATANGVTIGTVSRAMKVCGIKIRPRARGPLHPLYRGGTKSVDGYIVVSGSREHRLVGARLIGRPLQHWEVAHHVDDNRTNNADENIVVMTAREHSRFHTFLRHRSLPVSREWLEKVCRLEGQSYFRFTREDHARAESAFPMNAKSPLAPPIRHCRVGNCTERRYGNGLCSRHWQRHRAKLRGFWKCGRGRTSRFRGTLRRPTVHA